MTILQSQMVAKPWGRVDLPRPFANPGEEPIGEIWFEPTQDLDALLVKYIFTSRNLSVQCHPSDAQAQRHGLGKQGKDECWLITGAEPGARIAIGFNEDIDPPTLRKAAMDGTIEDRLAWYPVSQGDFFYIPANTVHSIGAGISLIEIQQNSHITYRLYDFGQQRELHLEAGVAVASGTKYPINLRRQLQMEGSVALVEGPYFRLHRIDGQPAGHITQLYEGPLLVIPLDCAPFVSGIAVDPGQCGQATSISEIQFPQSGQCLIAQPVIG